MKKRLIALFLCAATLFGMFPTILSAAASEEDIFIYAPVDGANMPVDKVSVRMDEHTVLTAMLKESASGTQQWQIKIGKNWVNIQGATDSKLYVGYGLVHGVLDDNGQAKVRCQFTTVEGKTMTSKAVTVQIYEPDQANTADLLPKDVHHVANILAPQKVEVHH